MRERLLERLAAFLVGAGLLLVTARTPDGQWRWHYLRSPRLITDLGRFILTRATRDDPGA
jgi:hypothetical protein